MFYLKNRVTLFISWKITMKFILPGIWRLTTEQKSLVAIDLDSPSRKWRWENLVIKGYWGTGKTVVAIHRILRLQKQGKKVLFLCFGKALSTFLSVPQLKRGINLFHLQRFYKKIRSYLLLKIENCEEIYKDGKFRIGQYISPKHVKKYPVIYYKIGDKIIKENIEEQRYYAQKQSKEFLEILFSRYRDTYHDGSYPYDEILIDEAQDLSPQLLETLRILAPHLSIFADENQRIGLSSEWSSIADIARIAFPDESDPESLVEELTINMRSTREICTFAAEAFLPENEEVKLTQQSKTCRSIPDSIPEAVEVIDLQLQKKQILSRINTARKKRRTTMIFADKQENVNKISERLMDQQIYHGIYHNNAESSDYGGLLDFSKDVFVATNKSSKGLETDCVILYITSEDEKKLDSTEEWGAIRNIYYVLATRARKKLYILYTSEEK